MPRTWEELVLTGVPAPVGAEEPDERGEGFFRRLRGNLRRTREALGAELQASLGASDDELWEQLEETLIRADVGAPATAAIVGKLESEALAGGLSGAEAITGRLVELLSETAIVGDAHIDLRARPSVILVVGVNGTGKTTTIGKLAWHLRERLGLSVLLGAADTFRAAAGEQLAEWAQRAGADLVSGAGGADPGAVAFDALAAAAARGRDVVICDTAGRLHNQRHLMDELAKVRRVIEKQDAGAPHETLLVVDATTGQNGLRQAQLFVEAAGVTGIALTKLDGTAKGGIAIAIARELGLPVKLIGTGEAIEDLRPFAPTDFARALVG